jgi:hypothetical protein
MKTTHPINNLLLREIDRFRKTRVFSSSDFVSLGNRAAIDQALSRLSREGIIERIGRGLYFIPYKDRTSSSPNPEQIAAAVARRTSSRVIPSGALSANILGLSTQVPTKMVFLTDGRPRRIRIGSKLLILRHASPQTVSVGGRTSAVVFQAMRYLGRAGVTDEIVQQIKTVLSTKEKHALERDIIHAVAWMRPLLKKIVEE